MKATEIKKLFEQFENASAVIEDVECWSARELQVLLDYTQWRNFANIIQTFHWGRNMTNTNYWNPHLFKKKRH